MKILFCIYQLDYADHIALAYLSAVAKALGHDTCLCVLKTENLTEHVKNLQPDVVAFYGALRKRRACRRDFNRQTLFLPAANGFEPEAIMDRHPIRLFMS